MSKRETLTLALPLAVVTLLGAAGCTAASNQAPSSSTESTQFPALTDIHVIGAAKAGGTNAANAGEKGTIYSPLTSVKLGEIATGEPFIIICTNEPKSPTLVVTYDGVTGNINLAPVIATMGFLGPDAGIPMCEGTPT